MKGGFKMPSTDSGYEKVRQFIKEKNIAIEDLAVMYGMKKQQLEGYLSGRVKTKKSNETILQIISDYKIR